ncbi:hypothetical protein IHV25_02740 [Phaeovibrio sulfidiphilus]|uniref:Uncharacterized protein n=1 Tax=Phaeovibrio sulfidiphilus TaxID=1220600 RepID=A0A8J7CQ85_9PROT|nr:hypothetical protein [Phaeovibrio sulfidiphilus]MBE1236570.1 hypothetical protein [Phaeovibrio sulfidiphilus]
MTTPVPPPSSPLPTLPGGSGTSMVASIPSPPPAMTALSPGTPVEATVSGYPSRGETLLQTPFGEVSLRTAQSLPADRALTLVYLGTGAQGQALVRLSWPGPGVMGPAGSLTGTGSAPTLTPATPVVAPGGPSAPVGIPASVVGPPGGPWVGALPAGLTPLPVGSLLAVRIVDIGPAGSAAPGSTPASGAGGPATGAAAGITQSVTAYNTIGKFIKAAPGGPAGPVSPPLPDPSSEATKPGVPQDGTRGATTAAGAARATGPSTLTLLTGLQLPGTIVSTGSASASLVDTALGRLAINTSLPGDTGTTIRVQILSAGGTVSAPGTLSLPLLSGGGWPALQDALALAQASAALGRSADTGALLDAMIRPGPAMLVNALGFLASLRAGGELGVWPGNRALRDLERLGEKGKAVASRLGSDLKAMAAEPREGSGPPSEWRVLTLPCLNDGEITPIRLITRHTPEHDAGDGHPGAPGDRFLVDVALSRLGPIQLDGFFQKGPRQMDLVVRSGTPLPPVMHRDIRALYNEALSALGFRGSIRFEAGQPFFEPPELPHPPSRPDTGGLVI